VRLEAFEENALYFLTRAFISARRVKDQWEIAAQMRMEILKAFKEHQIKLALPQRVLSATTDGQGNGEGSLTVRFTGEKK
jgi:small-conductance mechanosensitive channel